MDFLFGLSLFPLALIGLLIYAIIQWRRRRDALESPDPGIGTVRRLYFYSVIFVTLMMAANGVMLVATDLLDRLVGDAVVDSRPVRLASGLALVIVGLPLWAFHWRAMQRHLADLPVERNSILRKLFIYVTLGVAVGLLTSGLVGILNWALGARDFSGFHWAAAVVWSAVWWFCWRLEAAEGQHTLETRGIRRLYLYLVALVTLTILAVGAARLIQDVLTAGYASAFSVQVLQPSGTGLWTVEMRASLVAVVVIGGVWSAHWLRFASRDHGSDLRWVYLYLFAILGGAVTAVADSGVFVDRILEWLLAAPGSKPAVDHFNVLPGLIASFSIGVTVWLYHWWAVRREAAGSDRQALWARRTYVYILSALGLGTLVAASFTAINTALALLTERSTTLISGEELWKEPVALAVTLAIIGASIWAYYWREAQRRVGVYQAEERTALARTVYTFAVLGLGALALVGSASGTLFVLLRDLLDASLSIDTLRDLRPAVGIALTAGIIVPYQWSVYREDRAAEPEPEALVPTPRPTPDTAKQVSLLASDGSDEFHRDLEAALGQSVEILPWADAEAVAPSMTDQGISDLARRVNDANGRCVLLVPDGDGVRVLSYD